MNFQEPSLAANSLLSFRVWSKKNYNQSGVNLLYLSWELTLKLNCQKRWPLCSWKSPGNYKGRLLEWNVNVILGWISLCSSAWRKLLIPRRKELTLQVFVLLSERLDLIPNPLLLSDPGFCCWAGHRIACGYVMSRRLGGYLEIAELGSNYRPHAAPKGPWGDSAVAGGGLKEILLA